MKELGLANESKIDIFKTKDIISSRVMNKNTVYLWRGKSIGI